MERFFGGNPAMVLVRLAILSLVLGVLLSALDLSPFEIIESFKRLIIRVYNMGFDAIEWAYRYFLLGAIIVFPIWIVSRVLKLGGKNSGQGGKLEHKSGNQDL
jgi:hypothetical protein